MSNSNNQSWLMIGALSFIGILIFCGGLAAAGFWFMGGGFAEPVPPPPAIPTLPIATEAPPTAPPIGAPTITLAPSPTIPANPAGAVIATTATTPPTIDGNLDEWPDTNPVRSSFQVYNITSWDGTADITANWRLQWDATNLYFAVDVTDNIHVQTQTGNRSYQGDSLEIQIDTNRSADFAPQVSPDDFQFIFSPGNFTSLPPEAFRFRGTSANGIVDAPGHTVRLTALPKASGGYTLEAALPWSDLGLTPQTNLILGLALSANDNDTPNSAAQEVMVSHVPGRTLRDPTTWGTLTLR
ncbi:MAG TPA: sugar-binding protein [Anaerolineae bacterium]|nr:sugar-binding protein [Anaerolineae bacterium]